MRQPLPLERILEKPGALGAFTLFFALLIFGAALLGRMLGIPGAPLEISLVWPATGISLAALLLFGQRAWMGIFLGNLIYNFYFFTSSPHYFIGSTSALLVSLGSLSEVLLAAWIINKFSRTRYFQTVQDVFILLLPASFFTCLIASSVGAAVLYFNGTISGDTFLSHWGTFWLGDAMGIYVMTPLIVIWLSTKFTEKFATYRFELISMVLLFLGLCLLAYKLHYPLAHLFIPLTLWASYRFKMHGASLSIFLLTVTFVSYAYFVQGYEGASLFMLITFIGTAVVANLILAAVVLERERALEIIQNSNLSLKQEVSSKENALAEVKSEVHQTRKLASLGVLARSIAEKIQKPLDEIKQLSQSQLKNLQQFEEIYLSQETKIPSASKALFLGKIGRLKEELAEIEKERILVDRLLETIKSSSQLTQESKAQNTNLHTLINNAVDKSLKNHSDMNWIEEMQIERDFDRTIQMVLLLPEDFQHALEQLFHRILLAIHERRMRDEPPSPHLAIRTANTRENFEIEFSTESIGITPLNEPTHAFDVAREIIVTVHSGKLECDTQSGGKLRYLILLPKK